MSELALFPGSPGTKNRKERGEPGKHKKCHRENLSTCGRTNELPHTLFHRLCLFSYESFTADRMGLEGTTFTGSWEKYGEHTQTCTGYI